MKLLDKIPDPLMQAETIRATPKPQQVVYMGMHTCYNEDPIYFTNLSEQRCGEISVDRLLKGGRGHWSPLEAPAITISCAYVPHSVHQQIRTHRNISCPTQSFRYSEAQIRRVLDSKAWTAEIEKVVYFRPVGEYTNREGNRYTYSAEERELDKQMALTLIRNYVRKRNLGMSEEHCRGMLPFDYRQNFHLSGNLRSILHVLDLRSKADAQIECQWLLNQIMHRVLEWCPEIGTWYLENRFGKARLSP